MVAWCLRRSGSSTSGRAWPESVMGAAAPRDRRTEPGALLVSLAPSAGAQGRRPAAAGGFNISRRPQPLTTITPNARPAPCRLPPGAFPALQAAHEAAQIRLIRTAADTSRGARNWRRTGRSGRPSDHRRMSAHAGEYACRSGESRDATALSAAGLRYRSHHAGDVPPQPRYRTRNEHRPRDDVVCVRGPSAVEPVPVVGRVCV
jgi:hypothetical protein